MKVCVIYRRLKENKVKKSTMKSNRFDINQQEKNTPDKLKLGERGLTQTTEYLNVKLARSRCLWCLKGKYEVRS